jgi:multimeric flavodoxin WrbA
MSQMKIVSIVSSARQNGNTERIAKLFLSQLSQAAESQSINTEIEQISLCRENIGICRGCRLCFDKGGEFCPIKDDFPMIRDKILSADALILASPVYVEDVNGIMKNWIDRMAFFCHRPAFFGKYAVIFTTSGGGSTGHSLKTMRNALYTWGFTVIHMGKHKMGARMEDELIESFSSEMHKAAVKLIGSIRNKSAERPSFVSLLFFNIQQRYNRKREDTDTADLAYWKAKGWLDLKIKFYMPVRCSGVKLFFVKVCGALVSKMFI